MAWFLAMAKKALLQAKSITATTSQQTVSPDNGYDGLSNVTVNPQVHSETYTASTKNAALDMGAQHNNRYVNTSNIPNSNSGTYTFASGDTGGTKDMGETNSYRYVNATNVYNKGKADGSGVITNKVAKTSSSTTTTFSATIGKKYIVFYGNAPIPTHTYGGATVNSSTATIDIGTGVYKIKADIITATSTTVTITSTATGEGLIIYEIG